MTNDTKSYLVALLACSFSLVGCSKKVDEDEISKVKAKLGTPQPSASAKKKKPRVPATPESCRACEAAHPVCLKLAKVCDTLEGVAKAGPKAGTSKKQLCEDVVACVERTNCAKNHVSECYCGVTKNTECTEGLAHGDCKAELEAALESTDPGVVAIHFDQGEWAGAMAMWRYQCLHGECEEECF